MGRKDQSSVVGSSPDTMDSWNAPFRNERTSYGETYHTIFRTPMDCSMRGSFRPQLGQVLRNGIIGDWGSRFPTMTIRGWWVPHVQSGGGEWRTGQAPGGRKHPACQISATAGSSAAALVTLREDGRKTTYSGAMK